MVNCHLSDYESLEAGEIEMSHNNRDTVCLFGFLKMSAFFLPLFIKFLTSGTMLNRSDESEHPCS